ncbi:hypothetical protein IMZ48_29350 [Candidatus Bathyarchaeota archaeon]|nr:hypothetical protein [Candidatus Bathyarchaeota archaeon]
MPEGRTTTLSYPGPRLSSPGAFFQLVFVEDGYLGLGGFGDDGREE